MSEPRALGRRPIPSSVQEGRDPVATDWQFPNNATTVYNQYPEHLPCRTSTHGVGPYRPGEDFRRWLKGVERYMMAVNITASDRKCAVVLHLLGPDVADTYDTLEEPEGA